MSTLFLLITKLSTTSLGLEVVVAARLLVWSLEVVMGGGCVVPLGGPVHEVVAGNHRREPVEDLALGAAEGVENGGVEGAGPGVLSVGR